MLSHVKKGRCELRNRCVSQSLAKVGMCLLEVALLRKGKLCLLDMLR